MTGLFQRYLPYVSVLALSAVLVGCSDDDDDPTGPEPALNVEMTIAPDHVHTFESDLVITVNVTADGAPVHDFTTIRAELSPEGAETWTQQIPLLYDGTSYTGGRKFTTPGSFDVRVVGQRASQSEPIEIHRHEEHLAAVRPHFDAGGYRVEFETDTAAYPEHGYPIQVRFLIMEDVPSPRPPVVGLKGVMIRCTQISETEVHGAVEDVPGTYTATHTFTNEGGATAQLEFIGLDEQPAVVQIPLEVF